MGKKAGVELYRYDHDHEHKHQLKDQCLNPLLGDGACCCPDKPDDPLAPPWFFRNWFWRNELYEAMENEVLFLSITSLLVVDVLCIVSEFIVHDAVYVENHAAHVAGFAIKCTSLSILTIFQAENVTLLFALQEQFFWHVGHILDFFVIPISIIMETQLGGGVGSLLVILRFWRLVRVAHGVWESNQKKKGMSEEGSEEGSSDSSGAHLPDELKHDLKKAKKEVDSGTTAIQAAKDHHVNENGGSHDHFHDDDHDHAHEDFDTHHEHITNRTKDGWTPDMHEAFDLHHKKLLEYWESLEEEGEEEVTVLERAMIVPPYRLRMHQILDKRIVHNLISLFLVFDVVIVILEFFVHDEYFFENHSMHDTGFYLTTGSLSILAGFQLEAFMNMNATGRFLFEFYGHFLDCIIIPLSIVLEFMLAGGAASLLIMLRLWRLVRIMHGVFTADEEKEEAVEKAEEKKKRKEKESKREESLKLLHHHVIRQKSLKKAKAKASSTSASGEAGDGSTP